MLSSQLTFVSFVLYNLVKCSLSQTYPSSVFVPSNDITDVSLSCRGNELKWIINGTALNFGSPPTGIDLNVKNGQPVTQTLTLQNSSVLTYNGTSFQCSHGGENFSSVPTAFIIVYGKCFSFYC